MHCIFQLLDGEKCGSDVKVTELDYFGEAKEKTVCGAVQSKD
jgi:hypothetical protein